MHSKSGCPCCPDSAKNFEFSAKRLAENAETIKFSLFAEINCNIPQILFLLRIYSVEMFLSKIAPT